MSWSPTPNLSLAYHPVANRLLATDCGLKGDGSVGYWVIPAATDANVQWPTRISLTPAALTIPGDWGDPTTFAASAANLICTDSGCDLLTEATAYFEFLGSEYTFFCQPQLYRANSLDGDFGAAVNVLPQPWPTGDTMSSGTEIRNQALPFGINSNGRSVVASIQALRWSYLFLFEEPTIHELLGGGGLVFDVLQRDPPHAAAHVQVPIYTGVVQTWPTLARHPLTWRLYAAAQAGATVMLYTSGDQGLSWVHAGAFGLYVGGTAFICEYPTFWSDLDYLWMACYRPTPTAGAPGQVVLYQFRATPVAPTYTPTWAGEVMFQCVQPGTVVGSLTSGPVAYSGVVIGPSDAGRPAIIRDPLTKALTVLAPKTTAWTDTGLPTPGIVEYKSEDTGVTWRQKAGHALS